VRVVKTTAVLIPLVLLLAADSYSQTQHYVPVRNANALTKLQQSLDAMGGRAAANGVRTIVARGTVDPVPGSHVKAGTFLWKTQISPSGVEFRREFDSGGATWITVSGHGHPTIGRGDKRRKLLQHATLAMLPFHVPAVVLAMMEADPANTIRMKEDSVVNGVACSHIEITNESDPVKKTLARQDWYVDSNTGLPVRVEYRVPDSVDEDQYVTGAEEFGSYSIIEGIAVPSKMESFEQGILVSVTTITSLHLNPTVSDSDFDLPEAN
jgi:hypothetical protein